MIRRPDEYVHQNDSNAIVDELNVRGGRRVVANLAELYALSSIPDKLAEQITIVRVVNEDKNYRLVDKNNIGNASGWIIDLSVTPPEVAISSTEPAELNIKIWGKLNTLTDLDILRQIRDANPSSQLPALWLDSEDPYTQWEGVGWYNNKVVTLVSDNLGISNLINVNKLSNLRQLSVTGNQISILDLSGLLNLTDLYLSYNILSFLNLSNLPELTSLKIDHNLLYEIPSLIYIGSINLSWSDLTYNNFSIVELNRFRAMGFTDESKLLPQNP